MCNIKLFVQYILEIKILFEPFIVPLTILLINPMSTFCTLIIVGVPFVRPMENVTTTAGKNFSIRCYVAGYPVSQVTWSKGELRYIY